MKYQVARHLAVAPDTPSADKILLKNLYHGTRMLAGPEVWELLERFREPQELDRDSSGLESRAVRSGILVPWDEVGEENPLLSRFQAVSERVLRYRKTEPSPDLFTRLEQLAEVCQPLTTVAPSKYFIWQNPSRVFEILLEHFHNFLELEVGTHQSGDISSEFVRRSLARPPCQQTLEQQTCTLHTSWNRADLIAKKFGPGSKVLILGDDDLVSLALAQFPGFEIDVLEIDIKLVRLLKKESEGRFRVKRRDLSAGLPEEFREQYDVVVSDPMYAADGMGMFLECCSQALKPNSESRLFLSTYPPLLEDSDAFYAQLEAFNLHIHKLTEDFSRYPFPDDSREAAFKGLIALGFHPKLVAVLTEVPYLYAHLFECRRADFV